MADETSNGSQFRIAELERWRNAHDPWAADKAERLRVLEDKMSTEVETRKALTDKIDRGTWWTIGTLFMVVASLFARLMKWI